MIATESFKSESNIGESEFGQNPMPSPNDAADLASADLASGEDNWTLQLLKLRVGLDPSESVKQFAEILAQQLWEILKCRNVFVAACGKGRVEILGNESTDFPSEENLELVRNAVREISFDQDSMEAMGWPKNQAWSPSLVHKELTSSITPTAFSIPFRDRNGEVIGVVTVVDNEEVCAMSHQKLIGICKLLSPQLEFLQECGKSLWAKSCALLTRNSTSMQRWTIGIVAALLFCLIPIPHRISCDAEVNPIIRRFVAAPFEGILESSNVAAGDIVEQGQLLASLDEDEMRLQVSSISADQELARKAKTSALANGEALEAQQARLEFKKLSYKRELLAERSDNLEIHSPIRGVVLKSELEDADGAPLSKGQVLFEIAPLEKVKIKVFISQQDVALIGEGMETVVSIESINQKLTGNIIKIHPQAETFENESVFVAEVEFENENNELKPGMRGYAVVIGDSRPIGWILFRKPARYLRRLAGF